HRGLWILYPRFESWLASFDFTHTPTLRGGLPCRRHAVLAGLTGRARVRQCLRFRTVPPGLSDRVRWPWLGRAVGQPGRSAVPGLAPGRWPDNYYRLSVNNRRQ